MIARYGDTDYGYSEAGYGYGVRSFRGVFDGLAIASSFLGAWSFSRRLWSNVNVPLFRARRATDSAELDWFGTGPQGEVNITEFQSWCSGGNAFAVTLYDQSGLARNFTQSTTTIQPILAESGTAITENGRLAAKFVAADARRMSIPSSTAMFNALHTTGGTVLCVSKANDTAAVKTLLTNKNATNTAGVQLHYAANETFQMYTGRLDVTGVATNGTSVAFTPVVGEAATANTVWAARFDPDNATAASRSQQWRNGTASAYSNLDSGTPFVENSQGNLTLGARTDNTNPFDGTIQEILIWDSLIADAIRDAYETDAGRFYGITVA